MTYDEINPAVRAYLGAYEGLRKLGFLPEEIFCQLAKSGRRGGKVSCFAVLKTQGKTFSIECAPVALLDDFRTNYALALKAVNSGEVTETDLRRIWEDSECYRDKVGFGVAILSKGIILPHSNVPRSDKGMS